MHRCLGSDGIVSPARIAEVIASCGADVVALQELDVGRARIGAGRYERSSERSTWRNGYRELTVVTRLGQLSLRIPKLRTGSYVPPFREARKATEKALVSVIQEA